MLSIYTKLKAKQDEKFHSLSASSVLACDTGKQDGEGALAEAAASEDEDADEDGDEQMSILDSVFGRRQNADTKTLKSNSGSIAAATKRSALTAVAQVTPKKARPASSLPTTSPLPSAKLELTKSPSTHPLPPEEGSCGKKLHHVDANDDDDVVDVEAAEAYLELEEDYLELATAEAKMLDKLEEAEYASHAISASQKKSFAASAKKLSSELLALHKKIVQYHIKIQKRARVPQAALGHLANKRENLKKLTSLLKVMQEQHIQFEIIDNLVKPLLAKDFPIPVAIVVKHHMVELQEVMRCNDFDNLQKMLRNPVANCPDACVQSARKEAIEINLARMFSAIKAGDFEPQLASIERVVDIISAETGLFSEEDDSALTEMVKVLQLCLGASKEVNLEDSQRALASMQAMRVEMYY